MKGTSIFLTVFALTSGVLFAQPNGLTEEWEIFKQNYPGNSIVHWDSLSGGVKRLVANDVYLKSKNIHLTNVESEVRLFLNENRDLCNFSDSEIILKDIDELGERFIVTYQQQFHNIPLWNVNLKIKVNTAGQVLMIKSPLFSDLSISTQPSVKSTL